MLSQFHKVIGVHTIMFLTQLPYMIFPLKLISQANSFLQHMAKKDLEGQWSFLSSVVVAGLLRSIIRVVVTLPKNPDDN